MKQSTVIVTAIVGSIILFILVFVPFSFMYFGTSGDSISSNFVAKSTGGIEYQQNMYEDSVNRQMSESDVEQGSTPQTGIESPVNMYFVDYGTHVFVSPTTRPYSTFALDVDSASYTIAKNYVMTGSLPPTDAIRAEEFVNYFDYNYPNPEKNIELYTDLAQSPFDDDITYMRIGVKAKEPVTIKPKKITLVIDISGSMSSGDKLGLLKNSLSYLINNLDENDYITIITFNQQANLYMETQSVSDKTHILSKIQSLSPGGSTNAEAGLRLGYSKADSNFDSEYVNRVILLSDGVANVGTTSAGGILAQLKDYKEKGITLTSVGVGMGNYNDVLLEQIADKADGNYFYINELDEAIRVFDKQIQATMQIAGRDAKLRVNFDDNTVESYRLIGYENRDISLADFDNESVDAGEIGSGHEATALYELKLKANEGSICEVTLRYKLDQETYEEKTNVEYDNIDFSSASDDFKLAIAASRYAQILKLTAPPPQISKIKNILSDLYYDDVSFTDFKDVVTNAEILINQKR